MKVIKFTENKDGSATMEYELTAEERELFKKQARKSKKKFNDEFINKEILKALKREIKQEKKTLTKSEVESIKEVVPNKPWWKFWVK